MKINREIKNNILKFFRFVPDALYLKIMYYLRTYKRLNLQKPVTYNEKIQWLKLNDHNPLYTKLVDKYEVKEYVTKLIGGEFVIPTLGIWNSFEEIDFDKLPSKFVLKCTHDSGGLVICKDKSKLNLKKIKRKIDKSLKTNFYYIGREWPYKNVKPRIIAETYMEDDDTGYLTDYKFFCFNGEPKILYVSKDKALDPKTDFFDMNYKKLDMRMRDPNSDEIPPMPKSFEEMKRIAKILSKNIPHVRVDFYEINGRVYFGELTFYHNSGFSLVKPESWNKKMGDYIIIKEKE